MPINLGVGKTLPTAMKILQEVEATIAAERKMIEEIGKQMKGGWGVASGWFEL